MPGGRLDNLDPQHLESLRARADLPKDQIAVRTGVTPNVISRWFNGHSSPAPAHALALANVLGVDVLELTGKTLDTADVVDLRQRKGWRGVDAAEASDGEANRSVLYNFERAIKVPSNEQFALFARLYDVDEATIRRAWVNRRVTRYGADSLTFLSDDEKRRLHLDV
ncbi:helix-turn-helix domain-containing protein [Corynebacterium variabile]|uniref:helix-turn-helix domain-containing protein n=1 Tax=Corynebacterium variabile TaxID=1727 RepID=UPI00289D5A0D|nr:helix-turn-helix transcriptional regulator [Corynebacterium variabile]